MNNLEKLRAQMEDFDTFYITGKANIFYYSGFTSEDASLVVTKERAILITDSRYTIQAKNQASDFEIYDIKNGLSTVFSDVGARTIAYEEEYLSVAQFEKLKNGVKKAEYIMAQELIDEPRQVKEQWEIERIKKAEALGDKAFLNTLEYIKAGVSEKEIAHRLENFMRINGAEGVSFETIVASGERSAMPHGVASDKIIEKGDFVTLDFGCIFDGYCSDMTRTVVVGKATDKQKEIYNIVLKAQQEAMKEVRDGVKCSYIDRIARDIIKSAGYEENFAHSLGHSLGIQIHESPNFSSRSVAIARTGNVITVEPGIYIEGFGGVRIEDVVAIKKDGYENLTTSPKDLIEL